MFSSQETAYITSQRLARIATCSSESQPDVAPVGFEFDGQHFYIGGITMKNTLKYKNALGNPRVALVIDDLETINPMKPRGIKIHGRAEMVERTGYAGAGIYIRVTPGVHWSWGIEGPAFEGGRPVMKKASWR